MKTENYIKTLTLLLFCGALITLLTTVFYPDWSQAKETDIQLNQNDKWLNASMGKVILNPCLDKNWMDETLANLQLKAMLRETIQEEENGKFDFLYEITAKLTQPVLDASLLKEKSEIKIDYVIDLALNLIDEEGFVMSKLYLSSDDASFYPHEIYNEQKLKYTWGETNKDEIIIKVLLNSKIPTKIAQRTKKIVYEAQILVRNTSTSISDERSFINLKEYVKSENNPPHKSIRYPEVKG
jgi:hypothetical protein